MILARCVATKPCCDASPARIVPSSFARRRQAPDSFEVVVDNAVDDPKRLCSLLGGHLTDHKVDRIGKAQRIRPRRRSLAVGIEWISIAGFLNAWLLSDGPTIRLGGVGHWRSDLIFIRRRHDNRLGRESIWRRRVDPMGAKRVAGQGRAIRFLCRGWICHAALSPSPAPWLAASNSRTTWSAL
ncbi:hypothetical protein BN961_03897 [Afipia felis]|uniref:Uncharacterized protein n=1 Tax=Afipia felis TaxID=1035 RepID=A0A090MVD0_AFIFE|nr:hypothetical protein BN961_03897 [Afipia felis]